MTSEPTAASNLPAVGSVWGVPDQPDTWFIINRSDNAYVIGRTFSGRDNYFMPINWPPLDHVDITAMVQRACQLDAAIESATVDAKAMRLLSQFGNDVVASMSMAGQYNLKDLAYAAVLVSDHYYQEKLAENTLPFTVDWLVEIGGRDYRYNTQTVVEFGPGLLKYWSGEGYWSFRGMIIPSTVPITTRGDVLRWLDVLGIKPTKGA